MQKLLELLALSPREGDFGIEIEVEGDRLPAVDNDYWFSDRDGSLRDGMEYILKNPIKLDEVKKALTSLSKKFKENQSRIDFSFRTSVHVHVNVQQLTYVQILNMIYTYLLIEQPLINFCGESRKGNRFCLRVRDAEGAMDTFSHMFSKGEGGMGYITPDGMRYASINVEAMKKYGSLEFRAMEGNLEIDRITLWCTALDRLKAFAMAQESPSAIYNLFANKEAKKFFKLVMGDIAPAFEYERLEQDIQENFSLSIDLPFEYLKGKDKVQTVKTPVKRKIINPFVVGHVADGNPIAAIPWPAMQGEMQQVLHNQAMARMRRAAQDAIADANFMRMIEGE